MTFNNHNVAFFNLSPILFPMFIYENRAFLNHAMARHEKKLRLSNFPGGMIYALAACLSLLTAPAATIQSPAKAHPLAAIEADQSASPNVISLNTKSGRINLSAISFQYAHPSSYSDGGHAAPNVIDGKENTAWAIADSITNAWIEVSLGLFTRCDKILLTEYKHQIFSHVIEHYDGQSWKTLHRGGVIDPKGISFKPVIGGAIKVTILTKGGGGLAEIEAYDSGVYGSGTNPQPVVAIAPTDEPIGKSMKYVGLSGVHLLPDNNQPAWLKYFGINGVRSWYTATTHVKPDDLAHKAQVKDLQAFERCKAELRANPEHGTCINWDNLKNRSGTLFKQGQGSYAVDYAHTVFKKLNLAPICELNMGKWDETWQTAWQNWLTLYAWVYYLAREHEVSAFTYANEPEVFIGKISMETYVRSLQIHADAIRCAIEDVNRLHGKSLKPVFSAPVLAGSGTSDMARNMMRNLRTDYQGKKTGYDLVQLFDKHRYNARPRSFVAEIEEMQAMMKQESPVHAPLPIVYTEFNYSTGANWDKPGTAFTNDTPYVFRNMASVWGLCMEQGVHGMYLFRFADARVKGNNICQTLVREHDADTPAGSDRDIGDSSKNAEVMRLFAEGFQNERQLCKTVVNCPDRNYRPFTSFVPETGMYYIWAPQPNSLEDYPVTLDLSNLKVNVGGLVMIKEVSAAHFGEVVYACPIPQSRKLTFTQPKDSVWLIGITKDTHAREKVLPTHDAEVVQGASATHNYGKKTTMSIQQGTHGGTNHISFIKFNLSGHEVQHVTRAFLQLHGNLTRGVDEPFTILVYGLDKSHWTESTITAENAPGVCRTVSAVKQINFNSRPVAHMTFTKAATTCAVDVTDYLKEHPDQEVTFALIKEKKTPQDNYGAFTVTLNTKECPKADQQPSLELYRPRVNP